MKMQALALGLSLLLISTISAAGGTWELKDAPSGVGAKWVAEVKNGDGDTLKVYRQIGRSGYEAYAELTLASGQKFSDQMPLYQIDSGKVEDAEVIKRLGETMNRNWASLEKNKAKWRIWTSPQKTIDTNSDLAPWIKGNNLIIKYKNHKNQEKKSTFSLKGSGKAIKTAISGSFQ